MEDSSRLDQQSKGKSLQRTPTGSGKNDCGNLSGSSDNRNSLSGSKRCRFSFRGGSSANTERSSAAKPGDGKSASRSQTSKERGSTKGNTTSDAIIVSDSPPSSKRRSNESRRKRSRTRSKSPHRITVRDERRSRTRSKSPQRITVRDERRSRTKSKSPQRITVRDERRSRTRSKSPQRITVRDERIGIYRSRAPETTDSRTRHSRNRDRRSGSRGKRHSQSRQQDRSRSRSGGRRTPERRRDRRRESVSPSSGGFRQKRTQELQSLKNQIETLKAEISLSKLEREEEHERRLWQAHLALEFSPSPLQRLSYYALDTDLRQTDERFFPRVDDVRTPPQVDIPRSAESDLLSEKRSVDRLQIEQPLVASRQLTPPFMPQEPVSR